DDVQGERRLAGRLGAVDLGDPAARNAANAECKVQRDRSGRDRVDLHVRVGLAHLHDRALAELPLDLGNREFYGAVALSHWISFMGAFRTSILENSSPPGAGLQGC